MFLTVALALLSTGNRQAEPVSIVVHTDREGPRISKDLFGVFFEEINHAGDGGLNPELIRNFNFLEPAGPDSPPPGWNIVGSGQSGSITTGRGELNIKRTRDGDEEFGAENSGYWGIPIEKGVKYRYSIVCRSARDTPILLRLLDAKGGSCGEATVAPSLDYGTVKGSLTATKSEPGARLEVSLNEAGEASVTSVSLTPAQTWKGHGMRPDLAAMVDGLHPAFVRFPGGCYVEGGDYLSNRFRWETTLTDPSSRPGHRNTTWNYWSTDGLGYHEFLQWCEDMHAEALFVVNCGFSHRETVPMDKLDAYLSSTLDALEYALGPASSAYGSIRASRGHPAPFPLKYLEVGNENGQGWPTGGSPSDYAAHFKFFATAIKARYPQLTLVADTRVAAGADMVDDHYYNSPSWFWRNVGIYDKTPRTGPKVYVGEYAVTSNCGTGNLRAALAEAAFLTGLERNSDLVQMASYAPLFVNVNNRAWNPDAICFNGEKSYGTPSYYVQSIFGANRGDRFLPSDYPELVSSEKWTGGVGLGTWQSTAEFKDLTVSDGAKTLYASDFSKGAAEWQPVRGEWNAVDGVYRQTGAGQNVRAFLGQPMPDLADCTIRVKARKLSGDEGFMVLFHAKDSRNFLWWNIGGWNNRETGIEASTSGGRYGLGRRVPFSVETGRWYDIRIEVKGQQMQLYVDEKLIQTVQAVGSPTLAVSASRITQNGDLLLKVVNGAEADRDASIQLAGMTDGQFEATVTTLTSASMDDENSLANSSKIAPKTVPLLLEHNSFSYILPARSLTVLRLHRR